jgi:hypothetical protein
VRVRLESFILVISTVAMLAQTAHAQKATVSGAGQSGTVSGKSTGHHGQGSGMTEVQIPAAVSGGFGFGYGFGGASSYFLIGTPTGTYTYVAPNYQGMATGPIGFSVDRGPIAPMPRGEAEAVEARPVRPLAKQDKSKAAQYLTFGDRHFRTKNLKRAEERYLQAARADVNSAAALLRLAQVAIVREEYGEAAQRLREAETAEPGWIIVAPDVQSLYGEPQEFVEKLSRLESHLQKHPEDRDAWLVLGAQLYLSGRTNKAADVFLRLSDPRRRPDIALAAFLDATNQTNPK